jgi:hypothetical protein
MLLPLNSSHLPSLDSVDMLVSYATK